MSVINSMLRDLDRRHAPSPFKGNAAINANVQPASAQPNRVTPRSALVLCILIALVILSWGHQSNKTSEKTVAAGAPQQPSVNALPQTTNAAPVIEIKNNEPAKVEVSHSTIEVSTEQPPLQSRGGGSQSETEGSSPKKKTPSSLSLRERDTPPTAQGEPITSIPTTIIKQERNSADDINAERYQLARNALAQNQPQRAYELLKDNPPALASNTDYHAVLAAVEQQLKHFSDASLRYQQLLIVDQTQASWWLGLALSFEGQHRNADALAAYRRAISLNSLPDAAREYAITRIAALNHSAE